MKYSAGMRGHNHSKHTQYKKQHTISRDVQRGRRRGMRIVALVMAVLMLAGVVCSALVGTEDVAEAATLESMSATKVKSLWTEKKKTLQWSDGTTTVFNGSNINSVAGGMWHQYQTTDYVNWVDISGWEVEGNSNGEADSEGNVTEKTTDYMIGKTQELSDGKRVALGRLIYKGTASGDSEEYVTTVPVTTNGISQGYPVSNDINTTSLDYIADEITDDNNSNILTDKATDSDAENSNETNDTDSTADSKPEKSSVSEVADDNENLSGVNAAAALAGAEEHVAISDKAYSKKADSATILDPAVPGTYYTSVGIDEIYYSIQYCKALGGYYREYYVSTAEQLSLILKYYGNGYNSYITATAADINTSFGESGKSGVKKLGIRLLCDIDLGSSSGILWKAYRNTSIYLDIQGDGHCIYDGYLNKFLGSSDTEYSDSYSDKFIAISNLTFSNIYLTKPWGMFGGAANCYFDNVNFEKCIYSSTSTSVAYEGATILFGNNYTNCYLRDCAVRECYIFGSHCGAFGSWGNPVSSYIDLNTTYIGGAKGTSNKYYRSTIPSTLNDVEYIWNGSIRSDDNDNELTTPIAAASKYPSIFENCAVVDSEIYDTGSHSGTFLSCTTAGTIFRNCFSNSTIYGKDHTGVFCGACIGCTNGFYYNVDGVETLTNTVFENCFTAGAVEGNSYIGGFIGSIFADGRADDTNNRGKVIFENCYSTSSVGMQYSGVCVGGFVGYVQNDFKGTVNSGADASKHIFKNCYAAGETGGISTDTSSTSSNKNSIGGFIGTYRVINGSSIVDSDKPLLINCYYDMQTTAMRERNIGRLDIGSHGTSTGNYTTGELGWYGDSSVAAISVSGLTGVYTKASAQKGVQGLADTSGIMNDDTTWSYTTNFYPQLTVFSKAASRDADDTDASYRMKEARQELYQNYSKASTATVLLDHYDEVLNSSGEKENSTDPTIYDTIRDITRKFEFTSTDGAAWEVDEERNTLEDFVTTLTGADGKGISLTYAESDGIKSGTYTRSVTPDVLNIQKRNDVYKCYDFAPGKQWVKVTVGTGDTQGTRSLRLLPTAYLSAGNMISVGVVTNNGTTTNIVTLNTDSTTGSSGNTVTNSITLSSFHHEIGVMYALSDKYRMSGTAYSNQTLTKYSSSSNSAKDTDSFALYSGYTVEKYSPSVGVMESQLFKNTQENNSTAGSTIVRVYRASTENDISTTAQDFTLGAEITDSNTLKKWSGQDLFDNSDVGYYYMVYDWRLNDGRYLEDMKFVRITSDTYDVNMVTGILNEMHTVDEDNQTAIDQVANPGSYSPKSSESDYTSVITYPSDNTDFSEATASTFYIDYNDTATYGGDTYYTKTVSLTTAGSSYVAWKRHTDYKITTLIVEMYDETNNTWNTMARIDKFNNNTSKINFNNAQYSYAIKSYSIEQDAETKLYSVKENQTTNYTFTVNAASVTGGGIENYISFKFEGDGDFADVSSNLRVTALFRKNDSNISGEKYVLTGDLASEEIPYVTQDSSTVTTASGTTYESVSAQDKEMEVDDAGGYKKDSNGKLTTTPDDENRKAVMPGSVLTYRVKLSNIGYMDSSNVNTYDTVPEGTTYVANSMKMYKQTKNILNGDITYNGRMKVAEFTDSGGLVLYDENGETADGGLTTGFSMTQPADTSDTLEWQLPKIHLDEDYYLEYQVMVDDVDASTLRTVLTNTATWEFFSLNGTTSTTGTIDDSDIDAYNQYAIFTMNVDVTNTGAAGQDRTYTVDFKQNTGATYSNIIFTNTFPDGFTLDESQGILLKDTKTGNTIIDLKGNGSSTTKTTTVDGTTVTTKLEKTYIDSRLSGFKVEGLSLTQGDTYQVVFHGTQKVLGHESNQVTEIRNYSGIQYTEEGSGVMGNSITKTERITNEVETDVTWHYIDIQKTVREADAEQSFLMKVSYYADKTKPSSGAAADGVWYTRVNCTEEVTDTDASGNSVKTGYTGHSYFELPVTGWYTVEEVTSWSATDYGTCMTSYKVAKEEKTDAPVYVKVGTTYSVSSNQASSETATTASTYSSVSEPVTIYIADGTKTDANADSTQKASIDAANIVLYSAAYKTSQALDLSYWPVASYTNTEGVYAFRSGQAYQENDISVTK